MLRDRSLQLYVHPDVYAPAEDTFLLLSAIDVEKGEKALEMGCGSGIVSLHMAKAGTKVTAVDIDERAIEALENSAMMNGLYIQAVQSDLFTDVEGRFDLIVFNPPYLRGDVQGQEDLCWAGGEDGVQLTSRFLKEAKEHLEPDGRVLLLVSDDMDPSALDEALSEWKVRTVACKTLFFEELRVLTLTL
ncbi:MAG TPA: methyltransferase [Methanomassiliicoccales archaeon]|nr:methyltransferase [Methanomassiliicoccales archaeon]HPR98063.1 methyltransferase [Methanomassiliicoccales archaeon]